MDKAMWVKTLLMMTTLGTLLSQTGTAKAEDIAIVVGVGNYVNLPNASLPGINNDVDLMIGVLSKSFRVIRLFDESAGKEDIERAFREAAKKVGSSDRFVYYQSSHGSEDHNLLTYNTTSSGQNMISKPELREWMDSVKTKSKSLILDACFSGGFMKSRGATATVLKTKFYSLKANVYRDRIDRVVRRTDNPYTSTSDADTKAAYPIFASSQENQTSQVVRINGRPISVFTHYLGNSLTAKANAWNDVVQPTIRDVTSNTGNAQTPVFTSSFLEARIYGGSGSVTSGNLTGTNLGSLAQLYSYTNADPSTLELSVSASRSTNDNNAFPPDTKMTFTYRANRPGYLYLLNVDDENMAQMVGWGKKELDFDDPDSVVEQSRVTSTLVGKTITVGMGSLEVSTTARDGGETWKAFFFDSKEDALAFATLWAKVKEGDKAGSDKFKAAKLDRPRRISPKNLVTSEVAYKVSKR
jgi:hypothetical protein